MKRIFIYVALALFLLLGAEGKAQLSWTLPDTSVLQQDTILLPIITSDVTDSAILSFESNVYFYESSFSYIGISTVGTLTQDWLVESTLTAQGSVRYLSVSGASALPMSGSDVLFYIQLVCNTSGTVYFTGDNAVNEGEGTIVTTNGSVYAIPPPTLSISPNQADLYVGQSQQFTVYGGATNPIAYSVSDTTIAQIDSTGNLIGVNPGVVQVSVVDSFGYTAVSNDVVVRGFEIVLPDSSVSSYDTIVYPVRLQRHSAQAIFSGEFAIQIPAYQLTYIGYETENAATEDALVTVVDDEGSHTRQLNFVFANAQPIAGDDLIYLHLVANNSGGTSLVNISASDILLNETYDCLSTSSILQIQGVQPLSISPFSSTSLFVGDSLSTTVAGGQAPFTYNVLPSTLGTVDTTGKFYAQAGGEGRIRVTDVNGQVAETGIINVFEGAVEAASVCGQIGDTVSIPIYLSPLANQTAVYSFDVELSFPDYYLDFIGFKKLGTASENWFVLDSELANGNARIIGAGSDATIGDENLVIVHFILLPTANANGSYSIDFVNSTLNEGNPNVTFQGGAIRESTFTIYDVVEGAQSACNTGDNTYTQDLLIYHSDPTSGHLIVNDSVFSIQPSPQLITMTGLVSDGMSVDVYAAFSDDMGCTFYRRDAFVAPDSCFIPLLTEIYVDSSAMGGNNGSSWADAFVDLQDALSYAATHQVNEIWVAAGTYFPTTSTDRAMSFSMVDSVEIYGGFSGNETERNQRNSAVHHTILSGDIGVVQNASDNAFHVVIVPASVTYSVIDGCSIVQGNANGTAVEDQKGGGCLIRGKVHLKEVELTENRAAIDGSAFALESNTAHGVFVDVTALNPSQSASATVLSVDVPAVLDIEGECYFD